jgi:hypothetical protein
LLRSDSITNKRILVELLRDTPPSPVRAYSTLYLHLKRGTPRPALRKDRADEWHWWLRAKWLAHRHAIEDVHGWLVALDEARGHTFMTYARISQVLDAKDPETLVLTWLGQSRSRGIGLAERHCAWREGGESCQEPVSARNARYCHHHGAVSQRQRHTKYNRKRRCRNDKVDPLEPLEITAARAARPSDSTDCIEEGLRT